MTDANAGPVVLGASRLLLKKNKQRRDDEVNGLALARGHKEQYRKDH